MSGRRNTTPRRSRVRGAATARKLNEQTRVMTVEQGIYPPHIEATTLVDPDIRQNVMRSFAFQEFRVGAVVVKAGTHFYCLRFRNTHRYFVMAKQYGQWVCSNPDPEYVKVFVPRIERYRAQLVARKAA